jgi:hypothetical protein
MIIIIIIIIFYAEPEKTETIHLNYLDHIVNTLRPLCHHQFNDSLSKGLYYFRK